MSNPSTRPYAWIRDRLLAGKELALVDLREEARFATGHPLFAVQLALSRLEVDVPVRIPCRATPIVLYDDGEGLLVRAVQRLAQLGYSDVAALEGDLTGWREAGGELFIDVNVPSKAFAELVVERRGTPFISPADLKQAQDAGADLVVLDARRFDEYQAVSIPGGINVPGAELVLRAGDMAPRPQTRIVVNCAGRTRSIIGTQSLLDAGLPNSVVALRNGTIGWALAGQALEHGQARRFLAKGDSDRHAEAARAARRLADNAGVRRASLTDLGAWQADATRTTYIFDVRTPEEYERGHLPGSRSVPGGQLVQETDHYASVRGARIALVDDDGVRANMSASWLAQMGWDAHVLDGLGLDDFSQSGAWLAAALPEALEAVVAQPLELVEWLAQGDTLVLDFTSSANHVRGHIPGAWWALRSQLPELLTRLPLAARYVATCGNGSLAQYAAADLAGLGLQSVYLLEGGNKAWEQAGLPLEQGEVRLASPRIDRYQRPYEGTNNPASAMQAYLEWEYGLVNQLARDGTHGFQVIEQPGGSSTLGLLGHDDVGLPPTVVVDYPGKASRPVRVGGR